MTNSTEVSTSDLVSYIGYIVSGILLVIFDGLIVCTVLFYRQLRSRKEYFIIMSMALADLCNGIGYFTAGAWRTRLVLSGKQLELMYTWECLLKPFNVIWIWAEPASYTMLLCISTDRIIAVAAPIFYFKAKVDYAYKLVGVFWGWPLIGGLVAIFSSVTTPDSVRYEAICFTLWAVGPWFQTYYENLPVFCGAGSVLLYFLVPVIYKRKKAQVSQNTDSSQSNDSNLQKRLSITMGISAACTAMFFLAPKFIYTLVSLSFDGEIPRDLVMKIAPPVYLIPHINPLCNFALYTWRHMKFRKALICFLKCKELPGNFNSFKG